MGPPHEGVVLVKNNYDKMANISHSPDSHIPWQTTYSSTDKIHVM